MKKNFIKFACLVLSIVIAISISGCNNETKTVSNNGEYPGSPVKLNGKNVYPVQCDDTLEYWMNVNGDLGTKFENFGETPIAKKVEEETGVKITYIHPVAGQATSQVQIMLASDTLPDIVAHGWDSYPGGPQAAIRDEYIYELNDLVNKFAPGLKKTLENNEVWNRQVRTDEGELYVFPSILEKGECQVSFGPIIRKDWLDKLNLELPETIDEWETALTKFKEELGVQYPLIGATNHISSSFITAYGTTADWYLDGEEIKYGPIQPGYKEALKKLSEWYAKGLIMPDISTMNQAESRKYMLNDLAGAMCTWAASGMGTMITANGGKGTFKLSATQYPVLEKGQKPEYSSLTKEVMMGHGVAISKKCKNPELAARFLDFGFTEKGRLMYSFGIEGESFNIVDGEPLFSDVIFKNEKGYTTTEAVAAYTMNGNVPFVKDNRFAVQYYEKEELKYAQKVWSNTNMYDHMIPQIYVLTEQADEDADIMAAVSTYVDEMKLKFITGKASLDEFDNYVEQVKKFGIEKSIAFRQEAYERYKQR